MQIIRAHGFTVEDADEDGIHTPEATFIPGPHGVGVIMWSGAWPFAVDHDMGSLPTIEDACRYVSWLLKREEFYSQRDEALLAEYEE